MDNSDVTVSPLVIDFETTGIDPIESDPIEWALWDFGYGEGHMIFDAFIALPPGVTVPPDSSATHHIIDSDLDCAQSWDQTLHDLGLALNSVDNPVLVAHNASYEKAVLGSADCGVPWICTMKVARRLWPDLPSYKNETIRYHFKLGDTRGRAADQRTHSAGHDVAVTSLILAAMLKETTIDQMIIWTNMPTHFPTCPIGKHKGEPWTDIPTGYLNWMLRQADMDGDLKYHASAEIKRRG